MREIWIKALRNAEERFARDMESDISSFSNEYQDHHPTKARARSTRTIANDTQLETIQQKRQKLEQDHGLLRAELKELLPMLLGELRSPENLRALDESAWRSLADADGALGGSPELRAFAKEALVREVEDAQRRLEGVNTDIEKQLINQSVIRLEKQLYAFLDTALKHETQEDVRPNTARQVQRAHAARLARWLAIGGADLPTLVIDEPTLGLDPPSAARAMARYLRLRRSAESMRWGSFIVNDQAHIVNDEVHAPKLVKDMWTDSVKAEPEYLPAPDGANAFHIGPLSPQVILASYQTPALMAVADVEGTVCDAALRATLRKLIPLDWRGDVARELKKVSEEFRDVASEHASWCMRPPVEVVRVYWRLDPSDLQPIEAPAEYVSAAAASLEQLGLFGLRADIEEPRVEVERLAKEMQDKAQRKEGYEAAERTRGEIARLDAEARQIAASIAGRLFRWMLLTDLLPAVLADGERSFVISGVSVCTLPGAGGEAAGFGSARLRRIAPFREWLPADLTRSDTGEGGPALGDATRPRERVAPGISSTEITRAASGVWRVLPTNYAEIPGLPGAIRGAGMIPVEQVPPGEIAALEVEGKLDDDKEKQYHWMIRPSLPIPGMTSGDTFGGSIDDLSIRLIDWRYASFMASAREVEPIGIALSTYIMDQSPAEVPFLLSAREPERIGDESAWRKNWHDTLASQIDAPLLRIQQRLAASPRSHRVRLYPRCPAGAAIRVGAIFHHSTGFSVECDQNGEIWNLDGPIERKVPVELISKDQRHQGLDGLHLLLSISQPIREQYDGWRRSPFGLDPAVLLELLPGAGPDREAVSKSAVVVWAKLVCRAVLGVPESMQRLRIFCAAPNVLAVALGRELNAFGEIITMDWSAGVYLETFVFRGK